MSRVIPFLILIAALAACSPAADAPTATSAPVPAAVTAEAATPPRVNVPTFAFVAPTVAPQIATAISTVTAAPTAIALEPTAVARGLDRYIALGCAECHGDAGQGVDGVEGGALNELALTLEEFITFMRSGGTVGVSHQYSTNRLSDSGGRNLYLYLISLKNET